METWKDIPNYEGLYQVSDNGNVRSITHKDRFGHTYKGRILKQQLSNGYYRCHLSKDNITEWALVHRLVALVFCEKPEGCNIVNHIDANKENNHASNLEWTTYKGNMQWASKLGRMTANAQTYANMASGREKRKTPVIVTDNSGNETVYGSQAEAAKALGISRSHIAAACRKEYGYKTIKGYSFRYADDKRHLEAKPNKIGKSKEEVAEQTRQRMLGNTYMQGKHLTEETKQKLQAYNTKTVYQYTKSGEFVAKYPSTMAVKRATGIDVSSCVRGLTKTAGGYVWRYKENYDENI